jgi:polyhydroxyalkanoate synthesis regulator phasin
MKEMISKAIMSGLGFASLTTEAIRETANDLVKRSKLSEAEGKRLVKEFQQRSAHVQKSFEKKVESAVHEALKHLEPANMARKSSKAKGKRAGSRRSAKRAAKR